MEDPSVNFLLTYDSFVISHQVDLSNVVLDVQTRAKYAILTQHNEMLGYMVERDTGLMGALTRQVTDLHRPFNIDVFNNQGQLLFTIKRKYQFFTSKIIVIKDGVVIGKSLEKWDPIRRKYELFIAKEGVLASDKDSDSNYFRFGHIKTKPFVYEFPVKNNKEDIIAAIDRKWIGFTREFFTDGGVYFIRSGDVNESGLQQLYGDTKRESMDWKQKAVLLACAVSVDFDHFSRNSRDN